MGDDNLMWQYQPQKMKAQAHRAKTFHAVLTVPEQKELQLTVMHTSHPMDPDKSYLILTPECALQTNGTTQGHTDPNNHPHRMGKGHDLDNKCMQT